MGIDGRWSQLNDRLVDLQQERDELAATLVRVRRQLNTLKGAEMADLLSENEELRRRLEQQFHREASQALTFTPQEQEAMDAVNRALELIGPTWGLRANREELVAAVHTIQGFVVHHMLVRVDPERWGDWWASEKQPKES